MAKTSSAVVVRGRSTRREYAFDLSDAPWAEIYTLTVRLNGVVSVEADGESGALTVEVAALSSWETVDNQIMALILSRMPRGTTVERFID